MSNPAATQVFTDAAIRRRWDRVFYSGFAIVAIALVFGGFAPTYFLRPSTAAPLPSGIHLHAILFSLWLVLLLVQTSLVAARRTGLHMRLGMFSVILALAMMVAGTTTAITGARTGWIGPGAPRDAAAALPFLAVPLGDLVLFAAFFAAALYWRHRTETHKRLMLLATIGGVLPPGLGRLPLTPPLLVALFLAFLAAGPVNDFLTRRTVHRAYLWGVPLTLISYPVRAMIGNSDAWQSVARWLIG